MSSSENQPDTSTRGVKNPKVIDLIEPVKNEGRIVGVSLTIVEDRLWSSSNADELGEKFNNYLDYVLDGYFGTQFPQYQGLPITFKLIIQEEPPEAYQRIIEGFQSYLQGIGIHFSIKITD